MESRAKDATKSGVGDGHRNFCVAQKPSDGYDRWFWIYTISAGVEGASAAEAVATAVMRTCGGYW